MDGKAEVEPKTASINTSSGTFRVKMEPFLLHLVPIALGNEKRRLVVCLHNVMMSYHMVFRFLKCGL